MQRLSAAGGTLSKLSFTVSRVVDVDAWAAEGEKLFDKRGGPFKGIGSLARETHDMLVEAWKTGGSAEIAAAMNAFRAKHTEAFIENAPYLRTDAANYRPWSRRFAQWLYSTKHITIEYRIKYDGIEAMTGRLSSINRKKTSILSQYTLSSFLFFKRRKENVRS
jgi:hypothetical protein